MEIQHIKGTFSGSPRERQQSPHGGMVSPWRCGLSVCWYGEDEFTDGSAVYLGRGALAVNMLTNAPRSSWFPLGHYHGISVMVALRTAQGTLDEISRAFGGMPIDIRALRDSLCAGDKCFIMRATEAIEHIFSELYAVPAENRRGYCKLKVLELLLFLSAAELPGQREQRAYVTCAQADTMRARGRLWLW